MTEKPEIFIELPKVLKVDKAFKVKANTIKEIIDELSTYDDKAMSFLLDENGFFHPSLGLLLNGRLLPLATLYDYSFQNGDHIQLITAYSGG